MWNWTKSLKIGCQGEMTPSLIVFFGDCLFSFLLAVWKEPSECRFLTKRSFSAVSIVVDFLLLSVFQMEFLRDFKNPGIGMVLYKSFTKHKFYNQTKKMDAVWKVETKNVARFYFSLEFKSMSEGGDIIWLFIFHYTNCQSLFCLS